MGKSAKRRKERAHARTRSRTHTHTHSSLSLNTLHPPSLSQPPTFSLSLSRSHSLWFRCFLLLLCSHPRVYVSGYLSMNLSAFVHTKSRDARNKESGVIRSSDCFPCHSAPAEQLGCAAKQIKQQSADSNNASLPIKQVSRQQ